MPGYDSPVFKRSDAYTSTSALDGSKLPRAKNTPWGRQPELKRDMNGTSLLEDAQLLQVQGELTGSFPKDYGAQTSCLDCQGTGSFALIGGFDSTTGIYEIELDGIIDFKFLFGIDLTMLTLNHSTGISWTPTLPSMKFGSLGTFAPQMLMTTTIDASNLSPGQVTIGGDFTWSGKISLSTDNNSAMSSITASGDTVDWQFDSFGGTEGSFGVSSQMYMWYPLGMLLSSSQDVFFSKTNSMTVQSSSLNTTCGGMTYLTQKSGRDYSAGGSPIETTSLQACVDYCESIGTSQCVAVVWVKSGQSNQWCYPKSTLQTKSDFPSSIVACSVVRDAGAVVCPGVSSDMG
ncbi:hypothetical protein KVT40_008307 [Elsinoe batatas]|uniref:Apple domain-containing protein n=1 Tax=Elsinoe batatas TaxID=2601811 RepID=A0A8K0KWM5_9PEZI|nr:hypothetical protein KVT40_008307 [Elsinoe batatas]